MGQITENKDFRELQVFNSVNDYTAIKERAEAILLNTEFKELNFNTMGTDQLDLNSELLKSFVMKSWVDAKKNLSEWKDIQEICGDTEQL